MSKSIYHITEDFLQIMDLVEQADGELTPELEEALSINEQDINIKCANYFGVIKQYEGEMSTIDKEIERLSDFKAAKTRHRDRLKADLLQATLLFGEENPKNGVKSLNFETFRLSTRKNPRIDITDEESIETKYCDFSISLKKLTEEQKEQVKNLLQEKEFDPISNYTISKTRIKKDIEAGEEVEGAYLNKENFSLTIK